MVDSTLVNRSIDRKSILLFFFLILLAANFVKIAEPDVPWYLRAGEEIVRRGEIPTTDSFSYTSHQPWLNHEWLSEVVLSAAHAVGDFVGLGLFHAGLVALILLLAFYRRRNSSFGCWDFVAIAFACIFFRELISPRGQAFTDLFFATLFVLILMHEAGELSFRLLAVATVVICLLWTQFHGGAPHAIILFFLYFVSKPSRKKFALFLLAAGLSCVGPYGIEVHSHFLEAHRSLPKINEWKPLISLWSSSSHGYFVGILIFWGALWWTQIRRIIREKKIRFEILVFGFFSIAAIFFVRFLIESLIAGLIVAMPTLSEIQLPKKLNSAFIAIALVIAAVFYSPREVGFGLAAAKFPVEAVEFIQRQKLQGPLFNSYNFGGYLIWALPAEPVFIDGRAFTVYSERHFNDFIEAFQDVAKFEELKSRYQFKLAILQPKDTNELLINWMLANGWRDVYRDAISIVLTTN
jgi:hypothetical protein